MTASVANALHQSDRFRIDLGSCSFTSQFADIYNRRLLTARPALEASACKRWGASKSAGANLPFRSLADIQTNEECVIIGTLYKEMSLRPSVIRQLAELEQGGSIKSGLVPLFADGLSRPRLTTAEDQVFLEDEVQRIALSASDSDFFEDCRLIAAHLVTGVVVALRGRELESTPGTFTVSDALFLEPGPEHPITTSSVADLTYANFSSLGPCVAFVSGLGFVGTGSEVSESHSLALTLLGDWLRGAITLSDTFPPLVKLMILGDSIRPMGVTEGETVGLIQQARYLTRKTDADSVTAMHLFDSWLANLPLGPGASDTTPTVINGLSVDILPGPSDCVSHMLPQQPLHAAILPEAVRRAGGVGTGALRSTTNPVYTNICGRTILATSGQAIADLLRYTEISDALGCMEATLHWGHLAPTCPDTLFGYPLADRDPLVLRTTLPDKIVGEKRAREQDVSVPSPDYPDIYVVGNQATAAWRRASLSAWSPRTTAEDTESKGALMISVPRFDRTYTLVLLELQTFRCLPVRFDFTGLDQEMQEDPEQEEGGTSMDCIDSSVVE
nr:unnamed protein product [Spirometra erinaceieuropaei]